GRHSRSSRSLSPRSRRPGSRRCGAGVSKDRAETQLECGRHREVVGELEGVAARSPLRPKLHEQLILALYTPSSPPPPSTGCPLSDQDRTVTSSGRWTTRRSRPSDG